eukprot:scaffold7789_cov376-Prasinococcus_capsulatus_cf.AAC.2
MLRSPPKDVDWNNLESVKAYYERLKAKQNASVSSPAWPVITGRPPCAQDYTIDCGVCRC